MSGWARARGWLRRHDPGYAALRRAGRTAIVMPAMFAFGDKVIGDPTLATFAAFGSFAMLLLVDFTGPMRDRLQAHVALVLVGAIFICIATVAARSAWVAAVAMAAVAFVVLFAGVVSSVLASATTALLLAFILPVSLPGPFSSVSLRLAGWGLAGLVSLLALTFLWPAPVRDPLRSPAAAAVRALAGRLSSDIAFLLAGPDAPSPEERAAAMAHSDEAVAALRRTFLSTPYRPTGLSTPARTLVRLVDELSWLNAIVVQATHHHPGLRVNPLILRVKNSVARLLDLGGQLLDDPSADVAPIEGEQAELRDALRQLEISATGGLPVHRETVPDAADGTTAHVAERITSLEPSFRAQEMAYAAQQIATNIILTVAAERRSWLDRVLGRQPSGVSGLLAAAQERAFAHVDRHSVWLHNSVRGAVALGSAVLLADLSGVQHSFWVVLATLSVLRSNALNIGQNVLRGLLGTVVGFVLGAGLLALIGTNSTVLWILLPIAILVAGIAPAAISFAAGQAAFTVTLVILFNIIAPAGWRVGLIRVEDIGLGCLVSAVVGVLFWPRGAAAALGQALAEAYTDTAHYLAVAVEFGMQRCDGSASSPAAGLAAEPPVESATRAAAASRRLDDTFRSYLAERGAKPASLARMTSLVSGVVGLRLAADAVLDLWERDQGADDGDRGAARAELLRSSAQLEQWYDELSASFVSSAPTPEPLPHDNAADGRLIEALRRDLLGDDGSSSGTATRMIWTGDHLDAARRLQATLVSAG
jgi:uncharacterized membrane protein YccC